MKPNGRNHTWAALAVMLLGSVLSLGCQNSDPPSSIVAEPAIGRYAGFLFGIVGDDTLAADSATITVDRSKQYHADSSGRFVIDSVEAGRHLLSISHYDFFPFDATFDSRYSGELVLKLRSRFRDCLPLNIGNQWTYLYRYRNGSLSDGRFDNVDATFTWDVVSLSIEGSAKMWKVTEVCDSMRRQCVGWPTYHTDTTYGHSSGSFSFGEASDHRITIAAVEGVIHATELPSQLLQKAFYRYSRADSATGIYAVYLGSEFNPYTSLAKADTGIYWLDWGRPPGNSYWFYEVSLTACSLQPQSTAGRLSPSSSLPEHLPLRAQ